MNIYKGQIKFNRLRLNCANNKSNISTKSKIFLFRQEETKKVRKRDLTQRILWLILGGSLIGLVNGFFGGGGGMICVPILQKVMKLTDKQSHASAIAVILPLSVVSSIIYLINGFINVTPLIYVSVGVTIGGLIGAIALKVLPSNVVKIIFAIIMFAGGIKLII